VEGAAVRRKDGTIERISLPCQWESRKAAAVGLLGLASQLARTGSNRGRGRAMTACVTVRNLAAMYPSQRPPLGIRAVCRNRPQTRRKAASLILPSWEREENLLDDPPSRGLSIINIVV
jgi:hypothetical protein